MGIQENINDLLQTGIKVAVARAILKQANEQAEQIRQMTLEQQNRIKDRAGGLK